MSSRDALRRVVRKAEDVAGEGEHLGAAPGLQHDPVLGDLVLPLRRFLEVRRVDVLQADEHLGAAGARRLLDEVRDLVTHGVHLHVQVDLEPVHLAHLDDAVEDRLPVLVAGEVVVGDEVAAEPLLGAGADQHLDVVRRAVARLAPLHVDDRAEAARERAAASGVEARDVAEVAAHVAGGQRRQRLRLEAGKIRHEIVARPEPSLLRGGEQVVQATLRLAGEETDAERLRLAQIGRELREHRQTAADMEAADRDLDAGGAQLARDVHRARELVGLHADQTHEAIHPVALEAADDTAQRQDLGRLVAHLDLDLRVGSERAAGACLFRQTVQRGQRVRRHAAAPPLDHVAVVVVVRRLDEVQQERPGAPCTLTSGRRISRERKARFHGGSQAAISPIYRRPTQVPQGVSRCAGEPVSQCARAAGAREDWLDET